MLSDKPWHVEAVLFFVAGILSCFFFGMLAVLLLNVVMSGVPVMDRRFYEFLVSSITQQVVPIILAHFFLRHHEVKWGDLVGWQWPRVTGIVARAVVVALLAVPMVLLLHDVALVVVSAVQAKPVEPQPSMQVLEISQTLDRRILFSFAAVVLAPVTEEILFRGVLYAALKERGHPRFALLFTSLLFGAIHGSWAAWVPLTFFAIVLTLLYERTGKLLAPMICHATFNATNIFYYFWKHDAAGSA